MKILLWVSAALVYLLGLVYLILPARTVADLPGALKSDEPGDTWQNPGQSAYFTDLTRDQVMKFYQTSFSLHLGPISIKPYRLNYRPEDTATYVRGYIDSYYLEELVLPFRDSLFVNGWTPKLSPQFANLPQTEKDKAMINIKGQPFDSKITLRPYYSSLWARVLVWTLVFPVGYFVIVQFMKSINYFFAAFKKHD